jgi:hypothetical protein
MGLTLVAVAVHLGHLAFDLLKLLFGHLTIVATLLSVLDLHAAIAVVPVISVIYSHLLTGLHRAELHSTLRHLDHHRVQRYVTFLVVEPCNLPLGFSAHVLELLAQVSFADFFFVSDLINYAFYVKLRFVSLNDSRILLIDFSLVLSTQAKAKQLKHKEVALHLFLKQERGAQLLEVRVVMRIPRLDLFIARQTFVE